MIDTERIVSTKPSGRAFRAMFSTHVLKFNTKAGGEILLFAHGTQIGFSP